MRAARLIAAMVIVTAWVPVLVLPVPGWMFALPAVLTAAALFLAIRVERGSKGGHAEARRKALDAAIRSRGASATNDQQRGIASMQEDVRDAVQKLTGAMPGRSARHAIDALPWYLVLGAPESGKSSMLASSGLPFAYATPSGGARGNRGCRWWISQRAVWIDTAGAYTLGEHGYAEWLSMLKTLEETRPTQPLHGIVVTLAADALSAMRPEDLDAFGRRLRERIDEAQGFLGVDVPVHLVVTRCDLLPGFLEFFSDLREAERRQLWGFTLPFAATATGNPAEVVAEQFDKLDAVLVRRVLRRGTAREPLEVKCGLYQFPQWFRSLRGPVVHVASRLCAHSAFQDPIGFRGVYFTSAAEPIALAGGAAAYGRAASGDRGFFLRDLLDNVVIPDQEHGHRSAAERTRRAFQKGVWATALGCLAVLLATVPTWAQRENVRRVDAFRAAMNAAVAERPPVSLPRLDALRAEVASLRATVAAPPLHLRFGMFALDRLSPRAATLFAALVYRDVSAAVVQRHHAELLAFAQRYGSGAAVPSADERVRYGDSLRLYRFLTTPRVAGEPSLTTASERDWFTARFILEWRRRVPSTDAPSAAAMGAVSALYADVLAADPRLGAPRDTTVVDRVTLLLGR